MSKIGLALVKPPRWKRSLEDRTKWRMPRSHTIYIAGIRHGAQFSLGRANLTRRAELTSDF